MCGILNSQFKLSQNDYNESKDKNLKLNFKFPLSTFFSTKKNYIFKENCIYMVDERLCEFMI